ncbi:hypothetical protein GCM10010435_70470 [Winogradskya consettensis]|uniref:Gram-positive cocci surface proteins LPxTG domain-containing protein n=1 Tax=Winogradskya consettensis TaxID=113560 RepID=A0A919SME4_9ACTN|nr:LPXTG cell wall anchor domain-containing protein [Actinoplanes consettensis]GIM75495.1 hypothetical protein Aco04nite_45640 [Actinoplanes consettensis]
MIRKLAAGVAGLVLAALAAPLPAFAAPPPDGVTVDFDHLSLVPEVRGSLQAAGLDLGRKPRLLHDLTATIDTSGLAGVATVRRAFADDQDGCTFTDALITCAEGTVTTVWTNFVTLSYQPVPGAVAGAEGSATLRITSRELGTLTKTAKVVLTQEAELAVPGEQGQAFDVEPGDTVAMAMSISNPGTVPVTGVDAFFDIDARLAAVKKYSNCWYGTRRAYCHFDQTLEPGRTYDAAEKPVLRISPEIPAPYVFESFLAWQTPADSRDYVDIVMAQDAKKGDAGTLKLVARAATAKAALPQTAGPAGERVFFEVHGKQTANVTAVGAELTGEVGDTVTARLGLKNLGPSMLISYNPAAEAAVIIPAGTTVTKSPEECEGSGSYYVCRIPTWRAETFTDKGESVTWPFTLRIDRAGPLTGWVTVKENLIYLAQPPETNTTDNTADILIGRPVRNTATPGGTTPGGTTPGGTTPDGDGGGSGGEGGGGTLPITGANAAVIGVAGALLIAGGVVAFLVTRRRKSRFEA